MQPGTSLVALDRDNPSHVATLYAVRTHGEVACFLRGAPPASFADHQRYLQRLGPQKSFYLVQVGEALAGYCQLTASEGALEIGMALHPDYCNRGVGSEALAQLLQLLQGRDDLTRGRSLLLFVKKENARAIALYRKYGFSSDGDLNDDGEYRMQRPWPDPIL